MQQLVKSRLCASIDDAIVGKWIKDFWIKLKTRWQKFKTEHARWDTIYILGLFQVFDTIIKTKSITRFQDYIKIYLIEKLLLKDSTGYLTITFLMTSLQQNFDFDKWRSVVCSVYFKGADAGLEKDKVGRFMYNCMDWNSYLFAVNVNDEIINLRLKFKMTLIYIFVSENIYNILVFKTETRWRNVSQWR